MDLLTAAHLYNWVEHQFPHEQREMATKMMHQYEKDPELYDRVGWWRCFDDMETSS